MPSASSLSDLVSAVRRSIERRQSPDSPDAIARFKVFFASGLNMMDIQTCFSNLSETEKDAVFQLYNQVYGDSAKDIPGAKEDKLISLFCALFETSSNTSHIANAYSEEIWAVLHDKPVEEKDLNVKVSSSSANINNNETNLNIQLPEDVRREVNQISPGTYWAKNRKDGIYGDKSRNSFSPIEYLTLITVDGEAAKVLVSSFPILANHSFILTSKGQLERQKYGEHNKFLSVSGVDHRP